MSLVKVAAIQLDCVADPQANLAHAEKLVRKAANEGAKIILLPELFERPYFCQERRYDYLDYALPVSENPAVARTAATGSNNLTAKSSGAKRSRFFVH